jgi:hypothetical protein
MELDDLCSPGYRAQLEEMSAKHAWAGGGKAYCDDVIRLCQKSHAKSLLDYGCGNVDMAYLLKSFMPRLKVQSYDPGVPGRTDLPEPADVVMCVDCLEHVEPDKVQNVLNHIHLLTVKCALLMIATRPAEKRLPDGRNAHLTIDHYGWWLHKLRDFDDWKGRIVKNDDHGMYTWWRKLATTEAGVI